MPGAGAPTTPSLDLRVGAFSQIGMAQTTDYLTFFSSDQFGPAIYWNPAKDMRFGKGGAGLYNAFGFTEQMRIQSSTGNVGIGTAAPVVKLDVAGDINMSGDLIFQDFPILLVPRGTGGGQAPVGSNIALGIGALGSDTTGSNNTANGWFALLDNTTGNNNTAIGSSSMTANFTGNENTAMGARSFANNPFGNRNTALGFSAMFATSGDDNTAVGHSALLQGSGGLNTAVGRSALSSNTSGEQNVAVGASALTANTTGIWNTALGRGSLLSNTTGINNIAIGLTAGALVDGAGANNIHLGSQGLAGDNHTIRIGQAGTHQSFFAVGIRGVTTGSSGAIPVVIDANGQLGTVSSSRRFKEDIADMGDASRGLMDLRPVTFRYKQAYNDGSKPIQYGLIAEEVAEVYPDLVAHSADGQIESVKYQVLDSMLLNEVQKQQAEIRELRERLARLEALIEKK